MYIYIFKYKLNLCIVILKENIIKLYRVFRKKETEELPINAVSTTTIL